MGWATRRQVRGPGQTGNCSRLFLISRLPDPRTRPRLFQQTKLPVLVAVFGSKPSRRARITTPFILERAKSAKAGDAKPRAFGQKADGSRAAERMDVRRRARPSWTYGDIYRHKSSHDSGAGGFLVLEGLLCFSLPHSFFQAALPMIC